MKSSQSTGTDLSISTGSFALQVPSFLQGKRLLYKVHYETKIYTNNKIGWKVLDIKPVCSEEQAVLIALAPPCENQEIIDRGLIGYWNVKQNALLK